MPHKAAAAAAAAAALIPSSHTRALQLGSVRALLSLGANTRAVNSRRFCPLHVRTGCGRSGWDGLWFQLRVYCCCSCLPTAQPSVVGTAALPTCQPANMRALLPSPALFNVQLAASQGHATVVQCLLAADASAANAQDKDGWVSLGWGLQHPLRG